VCSQLDAVPAASEADPLSSRPATPPLHATAGTMLAGLRLAEVAGGAPKCICERTPRSRIFYMKIAFFELEGWEEEILKKAFAGHELLLSRERLDDLHLPERDDFEIISVFADSQISKAVVDFLPHLKFVATRTTGFDHLDLAALKDRKISASFVPGYGDHTVAEFTFGLMLNLTRKIYYGIDRVRETGSFSLTDLRGNELRGKTLGVIGTGRIGKEVIKMAKCFGLRVIASDLMPDADFANEYGVAYMALEDLLRNSDIITIHCPYNAKTHHLINAENVKFIKKGAYLINTARGGIVETEALIFALREGVLAGAALDVLEEEGDMKDELNLLGAVHPKQGELVTILSNHLLMKAPNVLITPHMAFNSQEALERILNMTIENINQFIAGKPINIIPCA